MQAKSIYHCGLFKCKDGFRYVHGVCNGITTYFHIQPTPDFGPPDPESCKVDFHQCTHATFAKACSREATDAEYAECEALIAKLERRAMRLQKAQNLVDSKMFHELSEIIKQQITQGLTKEEVVMEVARRGLDSLSLFQKPTSSAGN